MQAEHKKRDKARKAASKPASRFEEEEKKRGLLDKYDEEEEEAAMLIGDQGELPYGLLLELTLLGMLAACEDWVSNASVPYQVFNL